MLPRSTVEWRSAPIRQQDQATECGPYNLSSLDSRQASHEVIDEGPEQPQRGSDSFPGILDPGLWGTHSGAGPEDGGATGEVRGNDFPMCRIVCLVSETP